jgi:hypothetical protein
MKNLILPVVLFVAANSAFAQAAKFHSAEASVSTSGALTVSWDERGVGNVNVNYELTGNGTAVYACMNKGGNHPQAVNKTGSDPIFAQKTDVKPKNGRVVDSLTTEPPSPGNFSCPSGQDLVLACVRYTDLLLTDKTNNTSIIPTGTTSRTFLSTKGVNCF